MKRLLQLAFLMYLAASIFWSLSARAESIGYSPEAKQCMKQCTDQLKAELGQACLPKAYVRQRLTTCLHWGDGCKDWVDEDMVVQLDLCDALNDRVCGCNATIVRPVAVPTSGPREGKFVPTQVRVPLTDREDCEQKRHGVWVEVPSKRTETRNGQTVEVEGFTPMCFTLKGAWDAIQELKKRLDGMAPITQQDLDDLRAVKVICELPDLEARELRAKVEQGGGTYSLVVSCRAMRDKILAAERNAKEALQTAKDAKKTAKEALTTAQDAKGIAQQANANANGSLLRLSGIGGIYLNRTPQDGRIGNDYLGFGGGEVAWYPRIAPRVRLVMSAELGYSAKVYGSHSSVLGLGLGLANELTTDVIGSVQLFAQHFYYDNEWSKGNIYGVAPGMVWAPGLSKKKPGEVAFALSLDVPIGMGRFIVPGQPEVVQQFQLGGRLGLGIIF